MTLNFYLNNDSRSKKVEKAIFLYIRDKGKTFTIHCGERIESKFWDDRKQQVKNSYIGHPEINEMLQKIKNKVSSIIRRERAVDPFCSFEHIKICILNELNRNPEHDFFQIFENFIETRKSFVDKTTTTKYKTIRDHIKKMTNEANLKFSLDTIDLLFFDKLKNYFMEQKISNNTIRKYFQFFITFLKWSYERGLTRNNKFEQFKNLKNEETDNIALTKKDYLKIVNCKDLSQTLEKVRDVFLFQIYTGQRYSDIKEFSVEDVENGVWLKRQKKTKKKMQITLNKQALNIIKKYNGVLPLISGQKMNDHLKELGELAGLDRIITKTKYIGSQSITAKYKLFEQLSTHTARRTFVSITSYSGVSSQVVKKQTGHGSDKLLDLYFKQNNTDTKRILDEIFNN